MKIKQTVVLTQEEALKILTKVIENKTKKKVTKSDYASLNFILEELDLDAEQTCATPVVAPTSTK